MAKTVVLGLCVDPLTAERVRKRARRRGESVSTYLGSLIVREVSKWYPRKTDREPGSPVVGAPRSGDAQGGDAGHARPASGHLAVVPPENTSGDLH